MEKYNLVFKLTIPEILINLRSSGHRVYVLQISFFVLFCLGQEKSVREYIDLIIAIPLIINDLGNPCYIVIHIL